MARERSAVNEYNPLEQIEIPETCGHTARYFRERGCRIDFRGGVTIHPDSRWGYFITVISKSHQRIPNDLIVDGALVDRPVIVDKDAWICSGALLYNCHIGEGAIVSVGCVVRTQDVRPFVMVAGNPARVIARQVDGRWEYLEERWEVLV
jgi:acetyltransferase-like isoleucine patch superfamily enzyme